MKTSSTIEAKAKKRKEHPEATTEAKAKKNKNTPMIPMTLAQTTPSMPATRLSPTPSFGRADDRRDDRRDGATNRDDKAGVWRDEAADYYHSRNYNSWRNQKL